jgi:uridylate kinase
MDASAVSLARENRIPIIVFSIHDRGALPAVLSGHGRCTVIEEPR